MLRFIRAISVLVTFIFVTSCGQSEEASTGAEPAAETTSAAVDAAGEIDYGLAQSWLCLPGEDDYCGQDLTTTIVNSDGTMDVEAFTADEDAPIDCFYVYPTVSRDTTPNSDMTPGPGEISVIAAQFARYGAVCQTYAPLYRQITLTALRARQAGQEVSSDRDLAYNDVRDAWDYYLANRNDGRGVVLVGHSQGSGMLARLIAEEIDGKPVAEKMISAHLIGTRIAVPAGGLVGGAFKEVPLCTSADETGCLLTFASFRDDVPPPANSLFGRVAEPGMIAACNNPAALDGSDGQLHAYLSAGSLGISDDAPSPWVFGKEVTTPFVSVPGLLSAACVNDELGSRLSVTVHGNPADPRTDTIAGDVVANGEVQANWGLHLIDVHLAMGNLISLARSQGDAWLAVQE